MKTHSGRPDAAATSRYWNQLLAPYAVADPRKALFQLLSTASLFVLAWYLMLRSLETHYAVTLLLAVPAASLLIRLFIFQHDCGHGSFFRSRRVNDAVGSVLGILILTPYQYWRRTHALHHGTSGDLDRRSFGEIATLTVQEYLQLSFWRRVRYRVYRSAPMLLLVGPVYQFVVKHRWPWDIPRSWKREWTSVMRANLMIVAILVVASMTMGLGRFLMIQLPIVLMAGSIGVWLFYVQHQFEDTYWREHDTWDFHRAGLEGSSFYDLPKVLHWFTGNIGFHHIHHLSSKIPNYRLAECFRRVPELQHVTRLRLLKSLRCARLKLWDEEAGKLVGFKRLRELCRSASDAPPPPD